MKYRNVDTSSIQGLKKAEWYKAHGWKIISSGLFTITFEKSETKDRINSIRRERHQAMIDLGLKRVRGSLGGVYYE